MKKTFYQTGIFFQMLCFAIFAFFVLWLGGGINSIIEIIKYGPLSTWQYLTVSIIKALAYFALAMLFFKEFVRIESNNIHFDSEKIFMNDDGLKYPKKVQHYSEAKYSEIQSIDILWRNAAGSKMESKVLSAFINMPYLSITKSNGKVANFFILYFPKKSIAKIINELKRRVAESGSQKTFEDTETIMSSLKRQKKRTKE